MLFVAKSNMNKFRSMQSSPEDYLVTPKEARQKAV